MKIKQFLVLITFVFAVIICSVSLAATIQHKNIKQKKQKLIKVNKNIATLQQKIANASDKRQTLLDELKNSELRIAKLTKNIKSQDSKIKSLQINLQQLSLQEAVQQQLLDKQWRYLRQLLISAYEMGQHHYLKLLLNQSDPSKISRMMTYHAYLTKARLKVIQKIRADLQTLLATKQDIDRHKVAIADLQKTAKSQRDKLQSQNLYRSTVINKLSKLIANNKQKVAALNKDKRRLEKLLKKLIRRVKQSSFAKAFASMKGKLPWPAQGKIVDLYGKSIKHSSLTYNGVMIKAKTGTPVKAIFPGKVIFSDYLKSYGLLMIVDHGRGYLTLYAHNSMLYKKVGQRVKRGDVIATIGNSGGQQFSGLYFEIRRKGKPLDPKQWC